MHILGYRRVRKLTACGLRISQELKALSNSNVTRVKLTSAGVRIDGVGDLVVAAFIEAAEIKPHLRDVWIDANGT